MAHTFSYSNDQSHKYYIRASSKVKILPISSKSELYPFLIFLLHFQLLKHVYFKIFGEFNLILTSTDFQLKGRILIESYFMKDSRKIKSRNK